MSWEIELEHIIQMFSGDWVHYWEDRLNQFICVIDRNQMTRFVSYGILNVIGYRPEEIIGTKAFRIMDGSTRETAIKHWDEFLSLQEPIEYQYDAWTKSGRPIVLRGKSFVITHEGRSLGVISVLERLERGAQCPRMDEAFMMAIQQMLEEGKINFPQTYRLKSE